MIESEGNMEGLTAGRIVHYVMNDGHKPDHRAAIVINTRPRKAASEEEVNLVVFSRGHAEDMQGDNHGASRIFDNVPYDENQSRGTWHWIERA